MMEWTTTWMLTLGALVIALFLLLFATAMISWAAFGLASFLCMVSSSVYAVSRYRKAERDESS